MASSETIQLESFNTALHGTRILLQGPFPQQKLPPIMDYIQQLREPFKKKILVTSSAMAASKLLPMVYDCVIHATDIIDFQLTLAYLTYAGKSTLMVLEDPPAIPDGFWAKLPRTVTAVHIVTTRTVVSLRPYDAIFFAPMEEVQSTAAEYVYRMLQSVYRSNYTLQEHREILNEMRVAKAGVAWTNVGESRQGGAIYWYDTVEHATGTERMTGRQMADVLEWLATQCA
jgi:hypothetical protein